MAELCIFVYTVGASVDSDQRKGKLEDDLVESLKKM